MWHMSVTRNASLPSMEKGSFMVGGTGRSIE